MLHTASDNALLARIAGAVLHKLSKIFPGSEVSEINDDLTVLKKDENGMDSWGRWEGVLRVDNYTLHLYVNKSAYGDVYSVLVSSKGMPYYQVKSLDHVMSRAPFRQKLNLKQAAFALSQVVPSIQKALDFAEVSQMRIATMNPDMWHNVDELHDVVLVMAADLEGFSVTLKRLLVDSSRLSRAKNVPIERMDWDDNSVWAEAKGSTGDHYQVLIKLVPRAAHRCTCPDWQNNASRSNKIPCKHVIALANRWKTFRVEPRLSFLTVTLEEAKEALMSRDPRKLAMSYRNLSQIARDDTLPKT